MFSKKKAVFTVKQSQGIFYILGPTQLVQEHLQDAGGNWNPSTLRWEFEHKDAADFIVHVLTHEMPVPECRDCGACCVDPVPDKSNSFVDVSITDFRRLSKHKDFTDNILVTRGRKIDFIEGALRTKKQDGKTVCVALEGKIGTNVECSIYRDRPQVCREFTAGSPACLLARKEAGLVPLPQEIR